MRRAKYLLPLLIAVVVACPPQYIDPAFKPANLSANPECPHVWLSGRQVKPLIVPRDAITLRQYLTAAEIMNLTSARNAAVEFAAPGWTTNVPEFHDCQRLRVLNPQGEPTYDSLAAVFARDSLDTISDSAQTAGTVLAFVYMPDGGTYAPLKITSPYNCLVGKRDGQAWVAWMVPAAEEEVCDTAIPQSALTEARTLLVKPAPPRDGLTPLDIPPVARWEWDSVTATQYIGVRCGEQWCEVGRKDGFASSQSYGVTELVGNVAKRTLAIKGWYDEQHLAEYAGGKPVTSRNVGVVVPAPELDSWRRTDPVPGVWQKAATIHLSPAAGSYDASFNFAVASRPPSPPRSTVWICTASGGVKCPAGFWQQFKPGSCADNVTGDQWYARVDGHKGSKYFCVVYRGHGPIGFSIPAVARWRWRANDETIWISCSFGCCEVNADE